MTTETILTDAEIITIGHQARGIEPGKNGYILPVTFARAIEQAVLAKLAGQGPVAYAAFSNNGNIRLWSTLPQIGDGEVDLYPLYAHPMPNCQVILDSSNHIADTSKMVVPEGYTLVPVEITIDMCEASGLEGEFKLSPYEQAQNLWSNMIAAAPKYTGESK